MTGRGTQSLDPISDDTLIVVSGIGPEAKASGFFFAIYKSHHGYEVEVLDHLMSSGLALINESFHRVLCSNFDDWQCGEIISYDDRGVTQYRRVDGLYDPHGLAWDGESFIIPCSSQNRICWVSTDGAISKSWQAPGEGDTWHVNGVFSQGKKLFATAFGTFSRAEEWREFPDKASGFIFDVLEQRPIIEGLTCPHDPIFEAGSWIVCNSRHHELLSITDAERSITKRVSLRGWTRGLASSGDWFFVGESGQRHSPENVGNASLAIVSKYRFEVVQRIDLSPCVEVNSVCILPRRFLAALRRGFRTNACRVASQDRQELYSAIGNLNPQVECTPMNGLKPTSCRVSVTAASPPTVFPGELFEVTVSVENRSDAVYLSIPPHPVNIGARWLIADPDSDISELDERRRILDEPLVPGQIVTTKLTVEAPNKSGEFRLAISLVQEWMFWFDDIDSANGTQLVINVAASNERRDVVSTIKLLRDFEDELAAIVRSQNEPN